MKKNRIKLRLKEIFQPFIIKKILNNKIANNIKTAKLKIPYIAGIQIFLQEIIKNMSN